MIHYLHTITTDPLVTVVAVTLPVTANGVRATELNSLHRKFQVKLNVHIVQVIGVDVVNVLSTFLDLVVSFSSIQCQLAFSSAANRHEFTLAIAATEVILYVARSPVSGFNVPFTSTLTVVISITFAFVFRPPTTH